MWQPGGYVELLQLTPLYPYGDSVSSILEEGGSGSRYYLLRDQTGALVSDASVAVSPYGYGSSDSEGIVTLTFDADTMAGGEGLPTEVVLTVTGVTVDGEDYQVASPPSFTVRIEERPFTHFWEGGVVGKAKGGVSAGLIAYLEGEVKGGLGWQLDETDSSVDEDDRLRLEEQFQAELGGSLGLGAEIGAEAGISAGAGASAETELRGLSLAAWQSAFDEPYTEAAKKAQAAFVLSGLYDMAPQAHGRPLLAAILSRIKASSGYADYTEKTALGLGAEWTPARVYADAKITLLGDKTTLLGIEVFDVDTMLRLFGTRTDYEAAGEIGLSLEQEASLEVAALTIETPVKERMGLYLEERTKKLKEELFFDKESGEPVRLALSISSEGNPHSFTDVQVRDVTFTAIVEGDDLDAALDRVRNLTALLAAWQEVQDEGLIVGGPAALAEVNAYLSGVPLSRYEVSVSSEGGLTVVPEIGFTAGVEASLGAGVEIGKGRRLVIERGYLTPARLFWTEVYLDNEHGASAGKSIEELLDNAAQGAWLMVGDFFDSVRRVVEWGTAWTVRISSRNVDGVVEGGARLFSDGEAEILRATRRGSTALAAGEPVTITAASWTPESRVEPTAATGPAPAAASSVASGDGLAVGGVYQLGPRT